MINFGLDNVVIKIPDGDYGFFTSKKRIEIYKNTFLSKVIPLPQSFEKGTYDELLIYLSDIWDKDREYTNFNIGFIHYKNSKLQFKYQRKNALEYPNRQCIKDCLEESRHRLNDFFNSDFLMQFNSFLKDKYINYPDVLNLLKLCKTYTGSEFIIDDYIKKRKLVKNDYRTYLFMNQSSYEIKLSDFKKYVNVFKKKNKLNDKEVNSIKLRYEAIVDSHEEYGSYEDYVSGDLCLTCKKDYTENEIYEETVGSVRRDLHKVIIDLNNHYFSFLECTLSDLLPYIEVKE
jgi:hypothetical protein